MQADTFSVNCVRRMNVYSKRKTNKSNHNLLPIHRSKQMLRCACMNINMNGKLQLRKWWWHQVRRWKEWWKKKSRKNNPRFYQRLNLSHVHRLKCVSFVWAVCVFFSLAVSSRCRIIFIKSILKWGVIKNGISLSHTHTHQHTHAHKTKNSDGPFQSHSLGVNYLIKCDPLAWYHMETRHFSLGISMKTASPLDIRIFMLIFCCCSVLFVS